MKMSSIVLCLYISILIVFAKKNVFGIITFYSPKKKQVLVYPVRFNTIKDGEVLLR